MTICPLCQLQCKNKNGLFLRHGVVDYALTQYWYLACKNLDSRVNTYG